MSSHTDRKDTSTILMRRRQPSGLTLDGSEVFTAGMSELIQTLEDLVDGGGVHLVVTPNVNQVIDLSDDHALREAYARASLRILDGVPLIVLARTLGARRVGRNTGADLLPACANLVALRGWNLAIAGGQPGYATLAAENLQREYPGGYVDPFEVGQMSDVRSEVGRELATRLKDSQPQITFLCLGSPKQEHWFNYWSADLPPGVYVGAGAAVDFAAGKMTRAPLWIQKLGGEWLWRLGSEPRRLFRRYIIKGPRFTNVVIKSMVEHYIRSRRGA